MNPNKNHHRRNHAFTLLVILLVSVFIWTIPAVAGILKIETQTTVEVEADLLNVSVAFTNKGTAPAFNLQVHLNALKQEENSPVIPKLDPGNRTLKKADWWVVAHTPFKPPFDWYSYVYPQGWQPGIHVCVQMLPFQLTPSFEVLNMDLPVGEYTFYFALDENADGVVDETWKDSVEVRVK